MNLRERQDWFVESLNMLEGWTEKFNFIIELGAGMDAECPDILLRYRIDSCQSRSYFLAEADGGLLHVYGWSNAAVTGGMIGAIIEIFNCAVLEDLRGTEIDFHAKSGLVDNLTALRRAGLTEMLNRIKGVEQNRHGEYDFRKD
jgi:cysteine desulfuration protein SufE